MWRVKIKYRIAEWLFIVVTLFFNLPLLSQNKTGNTKDSTNSLSLPSFIPVEKTLFPDNNLNKIYSLIPIEIYDYNASPFILDTVKVKASKRLITKKIYNLLVVSEKPISGKQLTGSSENSFSQFTGKKIRNIRFRQLNVFGSTIENPDIGNPSKIENILNKTHLNTNEIILRKNLLFSEGDTLSPLTLSDNERLIRQLPYIEDSRIIVIPVNNEEVDIEVITKDVLSLGATLDIDNAKKGSASLFDKNLAGLGQEFRFEIPFDASLPDSPGFGIRYNINNILRSFGNLNLLYYDGLGEKTYGFSLERNLVSAATRYAGGISVRQMYTTEDLDTLDIPGPYNYNLQDYWLARSFLIDKESVTRIILGLRYINNNVFEHPVILPYSYHYLQKYKMYLGSAALSIQKFYKTSLIYNYGRTEDIPYGGLITITAGKEINEYKTRIYTGIKFSFGESVPALGYLYGSAGFGTFFNKKETEQGLLFLRTSYFSNLFYLGNYRARHFVKFDYTRGFDRYADEYLEIRRNNGFSGFRNDSIRGDQRLTVSLESVIFSPARYYGFRFAFFGFADLGFLFGTNENAVNGDILSSIGIGVRVRNDNLVFNTFQIRIGFFPNVPYNSRTENILMSGEQVLRPDNFDPGPPATIPYR